MFDDSGLKERDGRHRRRADERQADDRAPSPKIVVSTLLEFPAQLLRF